ncbi:hypothetical protein L2D71_31930 [Pseudomonas aeruginosa]|uniref:hypothetical protein n=2 Tax=Pseudomonas aeruginosa TaxID=287 RepID=UPI000F53C3DC|nr:hypothetical protein [Pseudomonas aeruginosa]MCF3955291.1 hypothetical protein [Pseudomonas aeruginosa]
MKIDKLEVVVEPPKHGSAKLEMFGLPVALGLSPEWGAEAKKAAELLEKRLARLEQALGLLPLS